MAGRLLFELFIFSIPFILFGLYLLATASAEEEGRRPWPIQMLFLAGMGLATVAWFALILMEKKERDICHEPARYEDGVIIPARDYPCEQNVKDVGVPLKTDPGGMAHGADELVETKETSPAPGETTETVNPDDPE